MYGHGLVWPWIVGIQRNLRNLSYEQSFQDSDLLQAIVKSALKCLQRKIDGGLLTKTHKIALFLDPKKRLLNGVPVSEKFSVFN